jgi:hypothetical protein
MLTARQRRRLTALLVMLGLVAGIVSLVSAFAVALR